MNNLLAIIGSLFMLAAGSSYVWATFKGKAHPNIVTWFIWTLLNVIVTFAAIADGAVQTAIFAGVSALLTGTITAAGLWQHGIAKYTKFDVVCLILAVVAIIAWRLTNEPAAAVAISLVADFFGILPTIRHAWQEPHREAWHSFLLSAVGSAITLLSLAQHNFVATSYPLWFLCTDATLLTIIATRRRRVPQPEEAK